MKIRLTEHRLHLVQASLDRAGEGWVNEVMEVSTRTPTTVFARLPLNGWMHVRDTLMEECFKPDGTRRSRRSRTLLALKDITTAINEVVAHPAYKGMAAAGHVNVVLPAYRDRQGQVHPMPPGKPGSLWPVHVKINGRPATWWTLSDELCAGEESAHLFFGGEVEQPDRTEDLHTA